jgi:hypothetical protein
MHLARLTNGQVKRLRPLVAKVAQSAAAAPSMQCRHNKLKLRKRLVSVASLFFALR